MTLAVQPTLSTDYKNWVLKNTESVIWTERTASE